MITLILLSTILYLPIHNVQSFTVHLSSTINSYSHKRLSTSHSNRGQDANNHLRLSHKIIFGHPRKSSIANADPRYTGSHIMTSSLLSLAKSSVEMKNQAKDSSVHDKHKKDSNTDGSRLKDGDSIQNIDLTSIIDDEKMVSFPSNNDELNPHENNKKGEKANEQSQPSSWSEWPVSTSLGSFLINRKKIEEEEMKKIQDKSTTGNDSGVKKSDAVKKPKSVVPIEIDQTIKTFASEAEGTFVSFIDLTAGKKDKEVKKDKVNLSEGLDEDLVREVDESVVILSAPQSNLMKDIEVLPMPIEQPLVNISSSDTLVNVSTLPLSSAAHTARIEKDMRHLAVSIASTVDDAKQWKRFIEDGGGLLPLLECIYEGAAEIRKGPWENTGFDEEMLGLVEKREEAFAAACTSCKTLRDLCTISKPFAAIVTDSILRANAAWATPVQDEDNQMSLEDGLISDLVTLLRFSLQLDNLYTSGSRRQQIRALRNRGVQRMGNRKQKRGEGNLTNITRFRCPISSTN